MIFNRKQPDSWRNYQSRIIKRADLEAFERRARSRERMQAVAGVCMIVVLATFAAALTWAIAGMVLP